MKKLAVLGLSALLLLGCNDDPRKLVLNSKDDLNKYSAELKTLSESEKAYLLRYFLRQEFGRLSGNVSQSKSLTVADIIKEQQNFEAEFQAKKAVEEQQKKLEQEQKDKAFAEFTQKYPLSVKSVKKEKSEFGREYLKIELAIKNNSDKAIIAIQPMIQYSLDDDKMNLFGISPYKFEPPLESNMEGKMDSSFSFDGMFAMKAEKNPDKLKAKFIKTEILFADGSSEKVDFPR